MDEVACQQQEGAPVTRRRMGGLRVEDVTPEDAARGARIRQARINAGFQTMRSLANAIGVIEQSIWRLERGTTRPKREVLMALAEVLRVDPEWILHGEARSAGPDGPPAHIEEAITQGVWSYLESRTALTPSERQKLAYRMIALGCALFRRFPKSPNRDFLRDTMHGLYQLLRTIDEEMTPREPRPDED